jgi:hypothetical protein
LGTRPRSGTGLTADEAAFAVASHLTVDTCGRILQQLVRIRSQNPLDGEGAVVVCVAGYLRKLGLEIQAPEVFPDRPSAEWNREPARS